MLFAAGIASSFSCAQRNRYVLLERRVAETQTVPIRIIPRKKLKRRVATFKVSDVAVRSPLFTEITKAMAVKKAVQTPG